MEVFSQPVFWHVVNHGYILKSDIPSFAVGLSTQGWEIPGDLGVEDVKGGVSVGNSARM